MAQITVPACLKKGDYVAIVSTARSINAQEVEPTIKLLESWGLNVVLGKHIYAKHHQFAGTDAQRLSDLQWAMDDPTIRAIICSRGGYGTARIIDHLDLSGFIANPKWVVGYSDITALHLHLYKNAKVGTIHGTMPINIKQHASEAELLSVNSLKSLLFGKNINYSLPNHPLSRLGKSSGKLIGGNLSMIYSLLGSDSCPSFNSCVLFLEDLDEYLYHIDRMMLNIRRNGLLENLSAVVVGGMTDMNDNTVPFGYNAEEIIANHLSEYDYPIFFGFPAGHQDLNLAIAVGCEVEIEDMTFSTELQKTRDA